MTPADKHAQEKPDAPVNLHACEPAKQASLGEEALLGWRKGR